MKKKREKKEWNKKIERNEITISQAAAQAQEKQRQREEKQIFRVCFMLLPRWWW